MQISLRLENSLSQPLPDPACSIADLGFAPGGGHFRRDVAQEPQIRRLLSFLPDNMYKANRVGIRDIDAIVGMPYTAGSCGLRQISVPVMNTPARTLIGLRIVSQHHATKS